MKKITSLALGLSALLLTSACSVHSNYDSKDVASVKEAYGQWQAALSSGSADKVVALYDDEAVLIPTLSNKPILTQEGRKAYFTKLMKRKGLKVTPVEQHLRLEGSDIAINSGLYTFSFKDQGKIVKIPARYTFVYEKDDGRWEIEEHHSSRMPVAPKPIVKKEEAPAAAPAAAPAEAPKAETK